MHTLTHDLLLLLSVSCILHAFPTARVSAAPVPQRRSLEVPDNFQDDVDQLPIDVLDVNLLKNLLPVRDSSVVGSGKVSQSQKVFPYYGKAKENSRTASGLESEDTLYDVLAEADSTEKDNENRIDYNWLPETRKTNDKRASSSYLPQDTQRAVQQFLKKIPFKNIPLKKQIFRRRPTVKRWWAAYYRPRPQMDRRAAQSKHYGCLKRCIDAGKLHPIQCHTLC